MSEKLAQGTKPYFMPAEWTRHEATWLQWPHRSLSSGYELKLERLWLMMVETLSDHERVNLIVRDEKQRDHIARQLRYHRISDAQVRFYLIPADDVWARDNGPIFVLDQDGELVITDWEFNGWGDRFEHALDNQVPARISEKCRIKRVSPSLVMEGGAVEVDGQGTFMATRTSILDQHRNPDRTQEEIEGIIGKYLGADSFIWLSGAGRGDCEQWGDTTDSHIDLVARFTPQSAILYSCSDDPAEIRHAMHTKHLNELKQHVDLLGLDYQLVPLPEPEGGVFQVTSHVDWRTTRYSDASYTNYYVANGLVLAPVFGNKNDQNALAILKEHFPEREIIGLDCVGLTENGGAIHCVTQQQPAAGNGGLTDG